MYKFYTTIVGKINTKMAKIYYSLMCRFAISIITCFVFATLCFAQSDGPKQITPQLLQKIKAEVEKEAIQFKSSISKKDLLSDEIEFAVDTFKIVLLTSKKMDIDYSTPGMNTAVYEQADAYDKLLNKYYNKLLKVLEVNDKQILIAAQKAWLAFRDSELKLVSTLRKEQYSGGGTIQSNIYASQYCNLIVNRTEEIFDYYTAIKRDGL